MSTRLTKDQLDDLAKRVDAYKLADKVGLMIAKDRYGQIRGTCPIHKGDNTTAFSIDYDVTGQRPLRWMCRTKCSDAGDVYSLVMKLYDVSFPKSIAWVASFVGVSLDDYEEVYVSRNRDMEDVAAFRKEMLRDRKRIGDYVCPDINEAFIEECTRRKCAYFLERGFSKDVLSSYQVGFCPRYRSEWKEDRVTVPFRNVDREIVGVSGRVLDPYYVGDKYKILSGSQKRDNLYNLSNALPYIEEQGFVVVAEGFSDVWKCWMMGVYNVVALMGKVITLEQRRLLLEHSHSVLMALDGDSEGIMASHNNVKQIVNFCTVYQYLPPEDKDLGDLDRGTLQNLMSFSNKITCNMITSE